MKGWRQISIGAVCKTGAGGTPLKSKKEYYDDGTIPWLLSGAVGQGEILNPTTFITQEGLNNSSAKLFPANTVLVAMYGATAGEVGILRLESATNQAVCGIYPNDDFVPKFLYYAILSKKDELVAKATGNAQPNISQAKIRKTHIPLPPLAEQERIVEILDEAFAAIATATASAEKNLANAQELFESELNRTFSQKLDGWVGFELQELTAKIGSGATPKGGAKSYKQEGISLIRSLNVHDRRFKFQKLALIDNDQANLLSNVEVESGDVLFNITGASIARCCVVPKEVLPARVNQHVSIVRPKRDLLSSIFLCYLMTSRPYKNILVGIGEAGATRQAITKTQLQALYVEIPESHVEQEHIVTKLGRNLRATQRLESIYNQKADALADLKQSILNKALTGELTADVKAIDRSLSETGL